MNAGDRIRQRVCGCQYDVVTGAATEFCPKHKPGAQKTVLAAPDQHERIAAALESIADSLAILAKPVEAEEKARLERQERERVEREERPDYAERRAMGVKE